MPSTSGVTSVVPKSTDVFVYTDFRPTAGTAYWLFDLAAALDDGEMPYPSDATFFAPKCLHDLRGDVGGGPGGGCRVAERRDDVLVAGLAVVVAVVPAADLRYPVVEQPAVGAESERGVVHDHVHVLVLHEILGLGEVRTRRLIVDVLDVDLAAVHATGRVLATDPGLAADVGVARRRRGHAGLREDQARP